MHGALTAIADDTGKKDRAHATLVPATSLLPDVVGQPCPKTLGALSATHAAPKQAGACLKPVGQAETKGTLPTV